MCGLLSLIFGAFLGFLVLIDFFLLGLFANSLYIGYVR